MNEDSDRLTILEAEATTKARRLAEEFQQKIDSLKNQILELKRQKIQILKGRISRAEAVERMKEDLRKGYEQWTMKEFVIPNLRTYQSQVQTLQNLDHIRIHQFAESQGLLKFLFAWVTESMIDEAANSLDEGPTEKEREGKIQALDKQINQLVKDMEGLLK